MSQNKPTGRIYITLEMMDHAIEAIERFRSSTRELHSCVESEVTTLISSDFIGSAADGFVNFYRNNIECATGSNLSDILDSLEQICQSIRDVILLENGIDEQLRIANNH